jgi:phosphoglycerol transferase MdoB-like AlkP superfamily enzyme
MKHIFRIFLGLLYLIIFAFSLLVLLKPGASIFYDKQKIDVEKVTAVGKAYAYQFPIDTHFFNPDTVLILEDQHVLTWAPVQNIQYSGNGIFANESISSSQITVLFVPTASANPQTNGHNYSIYIRPYLISSNLAGFILLLVSLGLIAFFYSSMADPQKRKLLLSSPFGFVRLWIALFDRPANTPSFHAGKFILTSSEPMKRSAINTLLISFLYVFMEWVFFATKPSFMDLLGWSDKVKILLISGVVLALLALLLWELFVVISFLLSPFLPSFHKYAFQFPAAFLLACLALILFDNFTYTIFQFGIVDTQTLLRVLYGLGSAGIFIYFTKQLAASYDKPENHLWAIISSTSAISLVVASLIVAGFTFKNNDALTQVMQQSSSANRPNIILFGTDGLNAANMSLYGYTRDTTPFITELAQSSLVSQNNFSNAASSEGSDTATLTGKLPLTTRVLTSPDILQGIDEYQHLPGLLKSAGYRTVFLGQPYYDDVNAANFQNAFDSVNCTENSVDTFSSRFSGYGFDEDIYFLSSIKGRITDRFDHIFFIKDMVNPFTQITQDRVQKINDQQRLQCLFSELDHSEQSGQPLFLLVHLEGTHENQFAPTHQIFSKGETKNSSASANIDLYDDAILDYDDEVNELVQNLKNDGQYDNTLLILYTDHAQLYNPTNKIPLVLHFPGDQNTGVISQNTQNIDIAPTILDYLNISQPTWMEGSSLLAKLDPKRLIIDSINNPSVISDGNLITDPSMAKPPFYQFLGLTVIQCQNWYTFNLRAMTVAQGTVANYVNPCSTESLDSLAVIREKLGNLLKQAGFDVPANW